MPLPPSDQASFRRSAGGAHRAAAPSGDPSDMQQPSPACRPWPKTVSRFQAEQAAADHDDRLLARRERVSRRIDVRGCRREGMDAGKLGAVPR